MIISQLMMASLIHLLIQRCDQFLTFSKRKEMLKGIVAGAKSSSVCPRFGLTLKSYAAC